MRDFWSDEKTKKINKKKLIITSFLLFIILVLVIIYIIYVNNTDLREWTDKNVFQKELLQEDAVSIEIEEKPYVYAYSQYLTVLSNNLLKLYNNSGNKEEELSVEITNPIFNSCDRFLAIGESDGQKAYLISNKKIVWEKKVEGNISQIHVNKNGYVAIVISNTSYKTIIEMYSPEGEELFKTYLSSTRVADVSISNDNKFLALAEVDTSGTIIQSTVKIVSIAKAQNDPTNSVERTYKAESNNLLTSIKYQEQNKLLCMYVNKITVIENEAENILTEYNNKNVTFSSIDLNNSSVIVEEKSSGLFTADSIVTMKNTNDKSEKNYTVKEVTKDLYTYGDVIALNLGAEIDIINKDGWLLKKYIAKQEITNIVINNNLVGIVYRNKIEIVKW